ncbi:MAG: LysR family transcriptional regulator [Alphaproteobacteria bacterium]|nr:LysR family transcriptional regulator [Alphaproteobacteria bacterium]
MGILERPAAVSAHTEKPQQSFAGLPDWDDFRLLLAVVEMGSFSRAATALNLTQPTVSRRVERLEKTIGARLVDRLNNGATLTLEGLRIVEQLHVAHNAITGAVDSIRSPRTMSEAVKLFTTDGLATYWLPRFLPSLFEICRDVELRTYTGGDAEAYQRAHFDLAIHYMEPNDPHLAATRLGTLHFLPYASQSYITRFGQPRSVAELTRHRLLDYVLYLIDKGSWMTRMADQASDARTQYFTNSSAALCEAVRQGAGIALLPSYVSVFEHDLVPLDIGLHFETPFWLCYQQDAPSKPGARDVILFLKHIFNRRTMPWFAEEFVPTLDFPRTSPEQIMASFSLAPETAAAR